MQFFLIWGQWALGTKIWPQGLNYLKYECWGPGESIDTHFVGFCEKIAIFKFRAKGALDPKFGPGVQIVSNMIARVQVRVAQMAEKCGTFRDQWFSHFFYLVILENDQKV